MSRPGRKSLDHILPAKTILVVDDDEDILDSFKILLSDKGYTVETALTGKEAIEKSNAKRFDIALLDITLPDIEGTKLLHDLRGQSEMRKVMITGRATFTNAIDSLNFGADAFLIKPISPDLLLKVIREQLHEQEQDVSVTIARISQFMEEREEDFVSVVRQSLTSLMGEPTSTTTIFHLGGEKNLQDPKKFAEKLKTFYDIGAETILKDILKKLESSRLERETN